MASTYVHECRVTMPRADEPAALGGAITVALCGHWDHEPPCPIAPHHTTTERDGDDVTVRVEFTADADRETEIRALIESALATGSLTGPDGRTSTWSPRT